MFRSPLAKRIQPFQQPERVLGFFNSYRDGKRVTRKSWTEIADQFQDWVNRSEKWGAPVLAAPEGEGEGDDSRRDRLLDGYFRKTKPNQVVAILKAREPARILVAIGSKDVMETFIDRGQLRQLAERICVAFLKWFEKIYARLTAALLAPFRGDRLLAEEKRCELDRLYQRVCDDLESLMQAVGLRITA